MYQDAFNQIAPAWYRLRHRSIMTEELVRLAKRWQSGRLLNLGCAHGADFVAFKDSFTLTGLDVAPVMADYLHRYSTKFAFQSEFVCADMSALPLADRSFDWIIAVASLHHLETAPKRHDALKEMYRVLRTGGEAFVTVWNKNQKRFIHGPKEQIIPFEITDQNGALQKIWRYYYLYDYDEINNSTREAGFKVIDIFAEYSFSGPPQNSRNICLLLKKEE